MASQHNLHPALEELDPLRISDSWTDFFVVYLREPGSLTGILDGYGEDLNISSFS